MKFMPSDPLILVSIWLFISLECAMECDERKSNESSAPNIQITLSSYIQVFLNLNSA
jgi:hypothetical protein